MSQTTDILKHLLKGNRLTGIEALNLFGCFRLPARIAEAEKLGHTISRRTITKNNKRFCEYWIEKK